MMSQRVEAETAQLNYREKVEFDGGVLTVDHTDLNNGSRKTTTVLLRNVTCLELHHHTDRSNGLLLVRGANFKITIGFEPKEAPAFERLYGAVLAAWTKLA